MEKTNIKLGATMLVLLTVVVICCCGPFAVADEFRNINDFVTSPRRSEKAAQGLSDDLEKLIQISQQVNQLASALKLKNAEILLENEIKPEDLRERLLNRWVEIEETRVICKVLEDAVRYSLLNRSDLNVKLVNAASRQQDRSQREELKKLASRQHAAKTLMLLAEFSRVLAYVQSEAVVAVLENPKGIEDEPQLPEVLKDQASNSTDEPKSEALKEFFSEQEAYQKKLKKFSAAPFDHIKEDKKKQWEDYCNGTETPEMFQKWIWELVIGRDLPTAETKFDSTTDRDGQTTEQLLSAIIDTSGHILTQPGFSRLSEVVDGGDVPKEIKDSVARVADASRWFLEKQHGGHRSSWLKKGDLSNADLRKHLISFLCAIVPPPGENKSLSLADHVDKHIDDRLRQLLGSKAELHSWLEKNKEIYEARAIYEPMLKDDGASEWKMTEIDFDQILKTSRNKSGYDRVVHLAAEGTIDPTVKKRNGGEEFRDVELLKNAIAQQIHEELVIEGFVQGQAKFENVLTPLKNLFPTVSDDDQPSTTRSEETALDTIYRHLTQSKAELHAVLGADFKAGNRLNDATLKKIQDQISEWKSVQESFRAPKDPADWLAQQLQQFGTQVPLSGKFNQPGVVVLLKEAKVDRLNINLRAEIKLQVGNAAPILLPLLDSIDLPLITLQEDLASQGNLLTILPKNSADILSLVKSALAGDSSKVRERLANHLDAFRPLESLPVSFSLTEKGLNIISEADPNTQLGIEFAKEFNQTRAGDFVARLIQLEGQKAAMDLLSSALETSDERSLIHRVLSFVKKDELLSNSRIERDDTGVTGIRIPFSAIISKFNLRGSIPGYVLVSKTDFVVRGDDDKANNAWPQDLFRILLSQSPHIECDNQNDVWIWLPGQAKVHLGNADDRKVNIDENSVVCTWQIANNSFEFGGWKATAQHSPVTLSIPIRNSKLELESSSMRIDKLAVKGPELFGDISARTSDGALEHDVSFEIAQNRNAERFIELSTTSPGGFKHVETTLRPVASFIGLSLGEEAPGRIAIFDTGRIEVDGNVLSAVDLRQAIIDAANRTTRARLIAWLEKTFGVKETALTKLREDGRIENLVKLGSDQVKTLLAVGSNAPGPLSVSLCSDDNGKEVLLRLEVDANDELHVEVQGLLSSLQDEIKSRVRSLPSLQKIGDDIQAAGEATHASFDGETLNFQMPFNIGEFETTARFNIVWQKDSPEADIHVDVDVPNDAELRQLAIKTFVEKLIALATRENAPLQLVPNQSSGTADVIVQEGSIKEPMFEVIGLSRTGRSFEVPPENLAEVHVRCGSGIVDFLEERFNIKISRFPEVTVEAEGRARVRIESPVAAEFIVEPGSSGLSVDISPGSKSALLKAARNAIEDKARHQLKNSGIAVAGKETLEGIRNSIEKSLTDIKSKLNNNGFAEIIRHEFWPGRTEPRGAKFDVRLKTKEPLGTNILIFGVIVSYQNNQLELKFSEVQIQFESGVDSLGNGLFAGIPRKLGDLITITALSADVGLDEFRKKTFGLDEIETALKSLQLKVTATAELDISKISGFGQFLENTGLPARYAWKTVAKVDLNSMTFQIEGKEGSNPVDALLAAAFAEIADSINEKHPSFSKEGMEGTVKATANAATLSLTGTIEAARNATKDDDWVTAFMPTLTATIKFSRDGVELIGPKAKSPTDLETIRKKAESQLIVGPLKALFDLCEMIGGGFEIALLETETFAAANLKPNGLPKGAIVRVTIAANGWPVPPIDYRIMPSGDCELVSSTEIVIPLNTTPSEEKWPIPAGTFGLDAKSITVTLPRNPQEEPSKITAALDAGVFVIPPRVLKVSGLFNLTAGKGHGGETIFSVGLDGRGTLFKFVPVGTTHAKVMLKGDEQISFGTAKAPFAKANFDIGGVLKRIINMKGDFFGGRFGDEIKPLVQAEQQLNLFGQNVDKVLLTLNEDVFSLEKEQRLFVAYLIWRFAMDPKNFHSASLHGAGGFEFQSWRLGGADIKVQQDYAKLTASVLGLALRMSVNSPGGLNSGAVRRKILELLWLDPRRLLALLRNIQLGTFRLNLASSMSWNPPSGNDGHGGGSGDPSSGDKDSYAELEELLRSPKGEGSGPWLPESLSDPGDVRGEGDRGFKYVEAGDFVEFQETENNGSTVIPMAYLPKQISGDGQSHDMFVASGSIWVPKGVYVQHGQLAHVPLIAANHVAASSRNAFMESYGITDLNISADQAKKTLSPRFYSQLTRVDDTHWHLFVMLGSLEKDKAGDYKEFWGNIPLSRLGITTDRLNDRISRKVQYGYLTRLIKAMSASAAERLAWAHVQHHANYPKNRVPQIEKGQHLFEDNSLRLLCHTTVPAMEKDEVVGVAIQYTDDYYTTVFVCGRIDVDGKQADKLIVVRMSDFKSFLTLSDAQQKATLREFLERTNDGETIESDEPRFPAPMIFGDTGDEGKGYSGLFEVVPEDPTQGTAGSSAAGSVAKENAAKKEAVRAEKGRVEAIVTEGQLTNSTEIAGSDAGGFPPVNKGRPSRQWWSFNDEGKGRPKQSPADRDVIGLWVKDKGDGKGGWNDPAGFFDPLPNRSHRPSGSPWRVDRIKFGSAYADVCVAASAGTSGNITSGDLFTRWHVDAPDRNGFKNAAIAIPISLNATDQKSLNVFYTQGSNWYAFCGSRYLLHESLTEGSFAIKDWQPWGLPNARIVGTLTEFTPLIKYEGKDRLSFWSTQLQNNAQAIAGQPEHAYFFTLPNDFGKQDADKEGWRRHRSDHIAFRGTRELAASGLPLIVRHRSVDGLGIWVQNDFNPAIDSTALDENGRPRVDSAMIRLRNIRGISQPGGKALVIEGRSHSLGDAVVLSLYGKDDFFRVPLRLAAYDLKPITSIDTGAKEQGTERFNWFYGDLDKTYSKAAVALLENIASQLRIDGTTATSVDAFRVPAEKHDILGGTIRYSNNSLALWTTVDSNAPDVKRVLVNNPENLTSQTEHVGSVIPFILKEDPAGDRTWTFLKPTSLKPQAEASGPADSGIGQPKTAKQVVTWFHDNPKTTLFAAVTLKSGEVVIRPVGNVPSELKDDTTFASGLEDHLARITSKDWFFDRVELAEAESNNISDKEPLFTFLNQTDKTFAIAMAHPSTFESQWASELHRFGKADDGAEQHFSHVVEFAIGDNPPDLSWSKSLTSPLLLKAIAEKHFGEMPTKPLEDVPGQHLFPVFDAADTLAKLGRYKGAEDGNFYWDDADDPTVTGLRLVGKRSLTKVFDKVLSDASSKFSAETMADTFSPRDIREDDKRTACHVLILKGESSNWSGTLCWQLNDGTSGSNVFWQSTGVKDVGPTAVNGILSDAHRKLFTLLKKNPQKQFLGLPVAPDHIWIKDNEADQEGCCKGTLHSLHSDGSIPLSIQLKGAEKHLSRFQSVPGYGLLFTTLGAFHKEFSGDSPEHELFNVDGVWCVESTLRTMNDKRPYAIRGIYTVPDSIDKDNPGLPNNKPLHHWIVAAPPGTDWPMKSTWEDLRDRLIRTNLTSLTGSLLGYRESHSAQFLFSRATNGSALLTVPSEARDQNLRILGELPAPPTNEELRFEDFEKAGLIAAVKAFHKPTDTEGVFLPELWLSNHLLEIVNLRQGEEGDPKEAWFSRSVLGTERPFDPKTWTGLFGLSWAHENREGGDNLYPTRRVYWRADGEPQSVRIVARFVDERVLTTLIADPEWANAITQFPRGKIYPLPNPADESSYFAGVEDREGLLTFWSLAKSKDGEKPSEWQKVTENYIPPTMEHSDVSGQVTPTPGKEATPQDQTDGDKRTTSTAPTETKEPARVLEINANARLGDLVTQLLSSAGRLKEGQELVIESWQDLKMLNALPGKPENLLLQAALRDAQVEAVLTGYVDGETRRYMALNERGKTSSVQIVELEYKERDWSAAAIQKPLDDISVAQCLRLSSQLVASESSRPPIVLLRAVEKAPRTPFVLYGAGRILWPRVQDQDDAVELVTSPRWLSLTEISASEKEAGGEPSTFAISDSDRLLFHDASPGFLVPNAIDKLKTACEKKSTEIHYNKAPHDSKDVIDSVYFLKGEGTQDFFGIGADSSEAHIFKFRRADEIRGEYEVDSMLDAATLSLANGLLQLKRNWADQNANKTETSWTIGPKEGSRILVSLEEKCWLFSTPPGQKATLEALFDDGDLKQGLALQRLIAVEPRLLQFDPLVTRLAAQPSRGIPEKDRFVFRIKPDQRKQILGQRLRNLPCKSLDLIVQKKGSSWRHLLVLQHDAEEKYNKESSYDGFLESIWLQNQSLEDIRALKTGDANAAVIGQDHTLYLAAVNNGSDWATGPQLRTKDFFNGNSIPLGLIEHALSQNGIRLQMRSENPIQYFDNESTSWIEWDILQESPTKILIVTDTSKQPIKYSAWDSFAVPRVLQGSDSTNDWKTFVRTVASAFSERAPKVHTFESEHFFVTEQSGLSNVFVFGLNGELNNPQRIEQTIKAYTTTTSQSEDTVTAESGEIDWTKLSRLFDDRKLLEQLLSFEGGMLRIGFIDGRPAATLTGAMHKIVPGEQFLWWAVSEVSGARSGVTFARQFKNRYPIEVPFDGFSVLLWELMAYRCSERAEASLVVAETPDGRPKVKINPKPFIDHLESIESATSSN
ncbi:MAG: hypothetical protein KDA96_00715, partial [Planctomycetaceae bacterium]|nr:hypothetical protein [Planctomycetaceae bacterium]